MTSSSGHAWDASARCASAAAAAAEPAAVNDDEERVTFGAELGSAVRREGRAQETVVFGEEVGPALVEPLGEDRRALDVREQEGDGATWRLHSCSPTARMSPGRPAAP